MHKIFILFFSILCTPIYSEYYYQGHVVLDSGYQKQHHTPHYDFSHNITATNPKVGSSYSHKCNFKSYTAHNFKHHFTTHGYTENQILNERCLYMFDEFVKFAQTYSGYKCTVQQLHRELKNLNLAQKFYYTIKGTYCPGLQKRIHYLYHQLNTLKNTQPNTNEFTPPSLMESYSCKQPIIKDKSLEAFQIQLPEYDTLKSTYYSYTPSLSHVIKNRLDAYNYITNTDYALRYVNKSYDLNNNVKQLLNKYEHDTTRFTQCFGNQLHQTIHQESLNLLEHIDNLSPTSVLYDHQEALIDFTVAMVDYNHENLTDKAVTIADFCWTLLDYGQAIAEGTALGIYSAATDILNNPIEATISVVASKPFLAYQLSKVLYNVADIGITALSDFDQAKDKWNKYTAPLNNIIDAINKKEISVRDAIKGGTAFVVGLTAQSRLLGGLGKFCNIIKQKSINFAQKNPLLKAQEYFTTPEGLLFKATTNSNKLKQSGQTTASNLKNNVENKIAKINSIKGLIKKELLPTTGKLRYVPPKKFHISEGLPRKTWHDRRTGFVDRFGNVWLKGEPRTKGQPFEWDVQLSKQGIQQVGWMTRDNSHLNVSLDGKVTHK